ncbi:MAG: prepilin-type N-terminal cleavage/methylation domain-containing protein [Planctomycetes bacterium]|nr:prepilin-type N-terminal cleavage/methylation domain-containing protein [Planctomycetota bacterium]
MDHQKGLTLIEILIAMIILSVGLIMVLTIFPVGIRSTKESTEDTYAAYLADSIVQALTQAMRTATPEDRTGNKAGQVTLIHDGLTGANDSYIFELPLPVDPPLAQPRYFLYPDPNNNIKGQQIIPPIESFDEIFHLANSPVVGGILKEVRAGPDPTDPYAQYGFAFVVRRVDDTRPATEIDTKYTPKPFFEFRIYIFRVPIQSGGSGYVSTGPKKIPPPINFFIIQLAGR